jgi:hypothetical protein
VKGDSVSSLAKGFCVEHQLTSTSRMDRAARSAMRSLVMYRSGLQDVLSGNTSLVDQI